MKTVVKTSVFLLMVAFVAAICAGTAMAAPAEKVSPSALISEHPELMDIVEMGVILAPDDQAGDDEQGPFPDGGDDECVGCDEQDVPDEGDDHPGDDGDDEGVVDEEQNPPVDEGDDEGKTDEEQTPPATDSGKKLPNTGTTLALIGGIGLAAALTAFATRRILNNRMR